jgi:hypothetical protein
MYNDSENDLFRAHPQPVASDPATDCENENLLESMVTWIAQDSETEPSEYLDECNTHQSGE